ncbi:hypothetical protein PSTT_04219, partial [Puccinia striiformis]
HDTELYPFVYPPNQKKHYQPTESHSSKKFSSEIRRWLCENAYYTLFLFTGIRDNANTNDYTVDFKPNKYVYIFILSCLEDVNLETATNIFDSISELEQPSLPLNWPNIEDLFQRTKLKTPGSTTSLIPQMMSDINLQLSNMRRTLGQVNGPGKQALQMFVEGPMGPKFAKGLLGSLLIQLGTILKKNIMFLSKIYAKVVPKKSWIKRLRSNVFNPHHDNLHLQCRILVVEVVDKTLAFLQDTKKILVVYNGNMEFDWNSSTTSEMVFNSIMEKGWFNVGKGVLQPASI